VFTVDEQVVVAAPAARVWELLSDPRSVVDCVPGARLTSYTDDGAFEGAMTVRFGPMRVEFTGSGTVEYDPPARRGTITAKGRDGRGRTRFGVVAAFVVSDTVAADTAAAATAASSLLTLDGEIRLTGPLAATIEGGASAVVTDMSQEFARAVAARAAEDRAPEAAGAPGGVPVRVWLRGAVFGARAALRRVWGLLTRRGRGGRERTSVG